MLFNLSSPETICQLNNSTISLTNATIHDFDPTFIIATESSLLVHQSVVYHGGHFPARKDYITSVFADCFDCYQVTLNLSYFENLIGKSGAALSFHIADASISASALIISSVFENCHSVSDGGAVQLDSVSRYTITGSVFNSNSAKRGGALYLGCHFDSNCTGRVSLNSFSRNTAEEGGALKWTGVRPAIVNNSDYFNLAAYGPFEASIPTHLAISNTYQELTQAPGQPLVHPIIVQLRDVLGQVVSSDNTTFIILEILGFEGTQEVQVMGNVPIPASRGVGNFSSLIFRSKPMTTLHMCATAPSIAKVSSATAVATSVLFDYTLRDCVIGELRSNEGCYTCPRESYLLNFKDSECHQCKSGAVCPGAAVLILHPGIWRPSNTSDDLFKCPEETLCRGGEVDDNCESGQTGRLCAECARDHFSYGHLFCFPCMQLGVACVIVSLGFGLSVLFALLCWSAMKHHNSKAGFGKVLLRFSHSLLCISCVSVGWKHSLSIVFIANEIFLSLGVAAFSIECFWNGISWVYFRAIIASSLPILCAFVAMLVACYAKYIKNRDEWRSSGTCVFYLLCFQVYPYIVKCASALLACTPMESGTVWLFEDMGEQCWTSTHEKYIKVVFVPMAIVYYLFCPSLILYSIYRRIDPRIACCYSESYPNWDLVHLLRHCILTVVLSLLTHSEHKLQILVCFWTFYFSLAAQIFKSPFKCQFDNRFEITVQTTACVLSAVSFIFQVSLPFEFQIVAGVANSACAAILVHILVAGGLMLKKGKAEGKGRQPLAENLSITSVLNAPSNSMEMGCQNEVSPDGNELKLEDAEQ